jgi:NAD(P)-dependent dehydrogenase (short-subunit alcohol dehydrogenase family)
MSFETTTGEVLDGVDLRGKIAVVTGASTGLGLETARALASVGAQVVLAGRDSARIDTAAATILDTAPDAMLEQAELDLASLASVRVFADWYASNHDRLHLLINNAGVMYTPFEHTAEGFEMQFGTNHVGHFLLTCLLVPQLLADPPSRVVNLSSGGHRGSDIVWDDINYERREYEKFSAYGQSKTANILFAVEASTRWAGDGITVNALHPGGIRTNLQRYVSDEELDRLRAAAGAGVPDWKSVEQGAATSLLLATSPLVEGVGGRYFEDSNEAEPQQPGKYGGVAPYALDPEAAARLWQVSLDTLAAR